jgi:hypothetical protein
MSESEGVSAGGGSLDEGDIQRAAAMIREWADYWYSDDNLGEKSKKHEDDSEGVRLVARVFAFLSGRAGATTEID